MINRRSYKGVNIPNYKHGDSYIKLHNTWGAIKKRCFNVNGEDYKDYGGRGITVCPQWAKSYIEFRDWALSHGYEEHLTIDRIDNDLDYNPENCQWITNTENIRKRGSNKIKSMETANEIRILYNTGSYTQKQLAKKYNVHRKTIEYIINNKTWKMI